MSNCLEAQDGSNIKVKNTVWRKILAFNESVYHALVGAVEIGHDTTRYTSLSNNGMNCRVFVPPGSLLHPRVYINMTFRVRGVGVATVSPNLLTVDNNGIITKHDCIRAFPISAILGNTSVSLGTGGVIQNDPHNYSPWLRPRFFNDQWMQNQSDLSLCPFSPDMHQDYRTIDNTIGNPMSYVYDCPFWANRNNIPYKITAGSNTPTTFEVMFEATESLPLSPFEFSQYSDLSGIPYAQMVDLKATFYNKLSRVWCHSKGGNTLTSLVVDAVDASLSCKFLTPPCYLNSRMPETFYIPYQQMDYAEFPQNPLLAPLSSEVSTSVTLRPSGIPSMLYTWLRPSEDYLDYTVPDVTARIKRHSVKYNNGNEQLSTLTEKQLYSMAVDNGYRGQWSDWCGYDQNPAGVGCGSVVALKFGKDICLPDNRMACGVGCDVIDDATGKKVQPRTGVLSSGMIQTTTDLTLGVTYQTLQPIETYQYTLCTLLVNEGFASITKNGVMFLAGNFITNEMMEQATESPWQYTRAKDLYGGSINFGHIKDTFRSVLKGVRKILDSGVASKTLKELNHPNASDIARLVESGNKLARDLGFGMQGGCGDCKGGRFIDRTQF